MVSVHLSLISYFESPQIDSTNSFHASTYTFLFYMENNNQKLSFCIFNILSRSFNNDFLKRGMDRSMPF
jgi:hypothetical protein